MVDLWKKLFGYRKVVLAILGVALIACVVYLLTAPTVFESRGVLRLGRSAGEPIMSIRTLSLWLKDDYGLNTRNRPLPFLANVKQEGDDALILTAEGRTADEAYQFLSGVVQRIEHEQSRTYQRMRQVLEKELGALDGRIDALDKLIKEMSSEASKAGGQTVTAAVMLQYGSLQNTLVSLLETRIKLQRELVSLNTYPTHVLRKPDIPASPSKPSVVLAVAYATLLGGIVSLLTVFTIEFGKKMRQQINRSQDPASHHKG